MKNTLTKTFYLILFFTFPANICVGENHPSTVRRDSTAISRHALIIEKIVIEGNTKTRPEVVFRYLTISAGDTLKPAVLITNNDILQRTDFFKEVDLYTRPGSEKGLVIVVIEITERKWPYYRFEGGHSDLNGWYIIPVSFRFDNILGHGKLIGWQWKIGDRVSGTQLTYSNPYLFHSTGYIDLNIYSESHHFVHYINYDDTTNHVHATGIRFKIGCTKGSLKNVFTSFRFSHNRPQQIGKLEQYFKNDFNNTNSIALGLGYNIDSRDNRFYPTSGSWGILAGELINKNFGNSEIFPSIELDARVYKMTTARQVFAFRIGAGYTTQNAPFYERFYLGGTYSLRGFEFGRLTPPGWGTKFMLSQFELRFPLSQTNFPQHRHTGVVFFDIGGIWLPNQHPRLTDMYSTTGLGYRIRVPIVGMVRLDLAVRIKQISSNPIYLNLGLDHTF